MQVTNAQAWLNQLEPFYTQLSQDISTNPNEVIQKLKQNQPINSKNKTAFAQYHLVLPKS